ncbi:Asp23/Gls24 family envelope stress response protein [Streptomyces sp. NPDC088354]|uniref:Asp23/Gls24 family envelope stress response protein n=1 Tax=unclassified Streptomyces TaxID=2593676 RepID=UPI0029A79E4D|nr:Asp23/Gls24 family envelope stress response protein [Streptomyces sp. MI02-7b]MDX3075471.1 Asp23/Gls24 family envelope stress response protein [Streptomyces sp. MI02-7b]
MTAQPALPVHDSTRHRDTGTDGLPPPAERGATDIPGKVVERIAARAAREAMTRRTGRASGRRALGSPSASAAVHHGSARLALSLDLPYPLDLARTGSLLRHDIAERVAQLTGLDVREVTLTVRRLVPVEGPGSGRVH